MDYTQMEYRDEIEIDIVKIGKALFRDFLLIVVSCAVGTAAAFLIALFLTPKYQSTAMFYVKNTSHTGSGSISSADIAASKELVESYIVILQSEETLEAVIWYAGADRTCEEVTEMIAASAVKSTEFFKVTVTSTDPREAERIANAIVYILPERIARIMEGTSARIVDTAVSTSKPCSPDYTLLTACGFLAGLLLSAGGIILQTILEKTIRSKTDIARVCSHPILAAVSDGEDCVSESYRLLCTKLHILLPDEAQTPVIGICSPVNDGEKSTAAVHLAGSLARRGKKVLLVDCCLGHSGPASMLPKKKGPGLASFLSGTCTMKQVVYACSLKDKGTAFSVIPAGEPPEDTAELLCSDRMCLLLKAARKFWDYVLLDLPPVGESSDMLEIAKKTDGILLLARRDSCNTAALQEALEQLEFVKTRILGLIYSCQEERKATNKEQNSR